MAAVILLLSLLAVAQEAEEAPPSGPASIAFGRTVVEARVVETRETRATALDDTSSSKKVAPFVICWPRDRYQYFENGGRKIAFDIVFINRKGVVVNVARLRARSRSGVTSSAEAAYALFLGSGQARRLDIRRGMHATLPERLTRAEPEDLMTVTINEKKLYVEVMTTTAERMRGYKYRKAVSDGEGMLFLFGGEARWSFWMKETDIPLSCAWGKTDGRIINIIKSMKPRTKKRYPAGGPASWGLEVPKGWFTRNEIRAGEKVVFSEEINKIMGALK